LYRPRPPAAHITRVLGGPEGGGVGVARSARRRPGPGWPCLRALVLLDRPRVPVGVTEEAEARARRAFGPHLLHLADAHAPAGEFAADGAEVVDDELDSLDRAGLA